MQNLRGDAPRGVLTLDHTFEFAESHNRLSFQLDMLVKLYEQLNLFKDPNEDIKEDNLVEVLDNIQDKFGKNSIFKATSLLKDSTLIERNKKIGGHAK